MAIRKYKDAGAQENWLWFLVYHGDVRCERCHYIGPALDFHHLDKNQKSRALDTFSQRIARGYKFREWVVETRYALLCSNCHRELHAGDWDISSIEVTLECRELMQKKRRGIMMMPPENDRLLCEVFGQKHNIKYDPFPFTNSIGKTIYSI